MLGMWEFGRVGVYEAMKKIMDNYYIIEGFEFGASNPPPYSE